MADAKRYYWMRLHDDFFSSKRIKKLRRIAGGDTYTIIYLKMQLKAIKTDGVLTYSGVEGTFAEEIALDIDEDSNNVEVTMNYLQASGLAEISEDGTECLLPYAKNNTGSETASTIRSRECRARQKELQDSCSLLHCNTDATPMQQTATLMQQNCSVEIEKDTRDIDTVIDTDIDKEGVIGGDAPTPPAPETQPEDTDSPTKKQIDFEGLIRMALKLGKPAKANEYYKMAKENGVSIDVAKLKAEANL